MKVKRLISFWYWNGKLFVCKDVCNLLYMGGRMHVWNYGQFGFVGESTLHPMYFPPKKNTKKY
jgi:hypothetical protein